MSGKRESDGFEDEGYDPPEQPEEYDEYEAASDDAGQNPYGEIK